jgi:hypothetical protein
MSNYKDLSCWKLFILNEIGEKIARIWPPVRTEQDPLVHDYGDEYKALFLNWTCAGIAYGRSASIEVFKDDVLYGRITSGVQRVGYMDSTTSKQLSVALHMNDVIGAASPTKACQCGGLKYGGGTCSDWCQLSPNYVAKD